MDLRFSNVVVAPLSGTLFGLSGVGLFIGPGNPNLASTDSPNQNLAGCNPGSLFIETDSGNVNLWQKTAAATNANPTGTWSSI